MHRLLFILTAFTATAMAGEIDQLAAVAALQQPNSILIDVRTAAEFAQGALPGATRIETQHLVQRIGGIAPDKDVPVVLYCRTGRRSSTAEDLLTELGYSQVVNAGGYDDLKAALPPHLGGISALPARHVD